MAVYHEQTLIEGTTKKYFIRRRARPERLQGTQKNNGTTAIDKMY